MLFCLPSAAPIHILPRVRHLFCWFCFPVERGNWTWNRHLQQSNRWGTDQWPLSKVADYGNDQKTIPNSRLVLNPMLPNLEVYTFPWRWQQQTDLYVSISFRKLYKSNLHLSHEIHPTDNALPSLEVLHSLHGCCCSFSIFGLCCLVSVDFFILQQLIASNWTSL